MIAIPNMKLPKGCDECPLTDGIRCKARDKGIIEYVLDFFASYHEKPTDCPLIEIDDTVWENEKYKLIRMTQAVRINKEMAERRSE